MHKEFNFKKHIGEAIHCKTLKEAKNFARYCDKHNIRWCIDDGKVSDKLLWYVHRENTCYYFEHPHSISYSRIGYFKDNNYKIIEWEDYMDVKKKEFNYKEHLDEIIHCRNKNEAFDFLKYCESWSNNINAFYNSIGTSCYMMNNINKYGYRINNDYKISIGDMENYKNENYKIIEWSDYMNTKKEFTKADLKSGDVIIRKNGDIQIVCLETDTLIDKTGYDTISDLDDDMTYKYDEDGNNNGCITKVYRPKNPYQCSFDLDAFIDGELVYDRNSNVTEMTIAEIEKALGIENLKVVK